MHRELYSISSCVCLILGVCQSQRSATESDWPDPECSDTVSAQSQVCRDQATVWPVSVARQRPRWRSPAQSRSVQCSAVDTVASVMAATMFLLVSQCYLWERAEHCGTHTQCHRCHRAVHFIFTLQYQSNSLSVCWIKMWKTNVYKRVLICLSQLPSQSVVCTMNSFSQTLKVIILW